jgi:hypothetical protein
MEFVVSQVSNRELWHPAEAKMQPERIAPFEALFRAKLA